MTLQNDKRPRGGDRWNAKLTDAKVLKIIARIHTNPGINLVDIAADYDVTYATISKIKHDYTWRHLPRPWPPQAKKDPRSPEQRALTKKAAAKSATSKKAPKVSVLSESLIRSVQKKRAQ